MSKKNRPSPVRIYVFLAFVAGLAAGYFMFSVPPEKIIERIIVDNGNYTNIVSQSYSNILAVSSDGSGLMGRAVVEVRPGSGRVLMNTNPFVEPDTQQSVETAKRIAESYIKKSLAKSDVIVSFDLNISNESTQVVGGPSAGASITLAIIAAANNEKVRSDVAITGTIEEDGSVGMVGAVMEKGEAAAMHGVKLFMVPEGEGTIRYYEKQVENRQVGGIAIQRVTYVAKTLSLGEYMKQWNISVVEVRNIQEAARYAIVSSAKA
ncbi:MAG: hypothetical protein HZB67_04720 [Candidatus Aenigmarchaeota archaeon]|nr:hypothetical protein [Candidatus Aenigmarchaeota archaeon]